MSPSRPPLPRALLTAVVAGLLALHAWLALTATEQLGLTADEGAHLVGGYSYWRLADYRLQPENGNLPQRWAALPLLALHPRLEPADAPGWWARSHVWRISQAFLFESGNNTDFMLFCARAAMLAWSVGTGLLVFGWSRRLWGETGGLLSLALFVLSPTVLAHAPLVTSDTCATFCLLAAVRAWGRLTRRIDAAGVALSLAASGLAAVAKFSSVLLLPTAALIAAWAVWRPQPITWGQRALTRRRDKAAALAALGGLHLLAAWVVVWGCFGFRYDAFAPGVPAEKFFVAWSDVMPDGGFWREFFLFTRAHHLLPEAYLQGFAYVLLAASQRAAFAAGQFSTTGWWWFFPYAFLVKSSLAELLATGALAGALVLRWSRRSLAGWREDIGRIAPLSAFAAVYAAFSVASHLNIGQRHILPLYPVLFIAAGALARRSVGRWTGGAIAGLLVCIAAVEATAVRPQYLAFFNRLAGGPADGWRHLVDSSFDWGQNVPRLAEWLRAHRRPGEPVYLTMFGSDDPFYQGLDAIELAPYYSFGRDRRWVELRPGLYCVSASMLQDVYSPFAGPWTAQREANYRRLLLMMRQELASGRRSPALGEFGEGPEQPLWTLDRARFARLALYLRARPPEAVIGDTIFVYRLTADELHTVVEGNFAELAAAIAARAQGN